MRLNGYRDVSAGHAREDVMRNPARWTASDAVGGVPMRLLAKPHGSTRLQIREPRAVHRPAGSFRDVVPGDRSAGCKPAGRIGAATHLRGATSGPNSTVRDRATAAVSALSRRRLEETAFRRLWWRRERDHPPKCAQPIEPLRS
ncbi:hypothetical protein JCM16408A_47230 [Methylobacterium phyllosphaerae]